MRPTFRISACCETDRGLVRSYNEDVCIVNNEDGYFLVADGMGGEAAGELASTFFRDTVVELLSANQLRRNNDNSLNDLVLECFHAAHQRILSHVDQNPAHKGMGCTAELLVYQNERIIIGHVGDSRTYRLRNSELVQLTTDHSFVQEQADLGIISQEQVDNHALKNLILRVVGSSEKLEVDIIDSDVLAGDMYLLCTDGLSSMVSKDQIAEILSHELEPEIKTTMLVDQANFNGGKDNITAVLVEFSPPSAQGDVNQEHSA